MSIEDPYFVVRDEVQSAEAACARKLQKWRKVMQVFFATLNFTV